MKFFHKCDLNSFTCWVRVGLASLPAFDCLSPAWRRHLNSPNWFMFINHAFCITRSVWGLMLRPAFYSRAGRDCEVDAKQAVDAVERREQWMPSRAALPTKEPFFSLSRWQAGATRYPLPPLLFKAPSSNPHNIYQLV